MSTGHSEGEDRVISFPQLQSHHPQPCYLLPLSRPSTSGEGPCSTCWPGSQSLSIPPAHSSRIACTRAPFILAPGWSLMMTTSKAETSPQLKWPRADRAWGAHSALPPEEGTGTGGPTRSRAHTRGPSTPQRQARGSALRNHRARRREVAQAEPPRGEAAGPRSSCPPLSLGSLLTSCLGEPSPPCFYLGGATPSQPGRPYLERRRCRCQTC